MTKNFQVTKTGRAINLIAGLAIFGLWLKCVSWGQTTSYFHSAEASLFFGHLAGTAFLIIVAIPFSRYISQLKIKGGTMKDCVVLGLAVIALYMLVFWLEKYLGTSSEPFVSRLMSYQGTAFIATCVTIFILAPLGEELLFRGMLFSAFTGGSRWVQVMGIVITSTLFMMLHVQYVFLLTKVELFLVAVIFCVARLRSGGLLLPVGLHSLASLMAILL